MRRFRKLQIAVGTLLAIWSTSVWADPTGERIYQQQCARCHGPAGEGTNDKYPNPLVGDHSVSQLAALVAETMPEDQDEKCSAQDAQQVAAYIYDAFYSPEAQFRNKPARIELSRLTIRQYQNAVTDLIGSFREPASWGTKHGLIGRYFDSREFKPDARKIERTDEQVHFNFGEGSPDPSQINSQAFSIFWEGSILAPDTGDYEFIIRTENAARLWVNDKRTPLIDAWVKSGDETEYRAETLLLGGRAYPLKLEFSRATQGVGDELQKKNKPKPEPTASISLEWKRPYHAAEVIPASHLFVGTGPELFVLHAAFPPDDRSVGYERGTTISKVWDYATTEAAIEVAGYVADNVKELANVADDADEREARLIDFCHTFAERAFRRPLTDEQKLAYVDRQFAEARDQELAVKRFVLLALKSPRFLYRELGDGDSNDPYNLAARLSFSLWDSLPDEQLRRAAAAGQLADWQHVVDHIDRMFPDSRTYSKLRSFILTWLKVSQPPDLSKDPRLYPEFTPDAVSDLRKSLELSIDDVLASEAADFRQLLLGDSIFLNGRLAAIYGAELPKDAPFEKVRCQPERRSGIVSHPYLLACFAYKNSSSPIHRGVFLSRNLLGRSLRQPPEAVAPLPVELHAAMTTRERVAMQTKPEACQSCHSMINPLGFSLEQFDAIGRYRNVDRDKPIDAAGSYVTQLGNIVQFNGAADLAQFLANSEEAQSAFVRQMFHHMVKQPIRAYGPDRWEQLQRRFADDDFNIRKLVAEIVAISAVPPKFASEVAETKLNRKR